MILEAIAEARRGGARLAAACSVIGLPAPGMEGAPTDESMPDPTALPRVLGLRLRDPYSGDLVDKAKEATGPTTDKAKDKAGELLGKVKGLLGSKDDADGSDKS